MSKKRNSVWIFLIPLLVTFMNLVSALNPSINLINITPSLDITFFENYNITANITNNSLMDVVTVNISQINGDGDSCWEFFVNGSCSAYAGEIFSMSLESESIWKRAPIRPDNIYPQIEFGIDELFGIMLRQISL